MGCPASDVMGVSGRRMLASLVEGEASLEALADLAKGRLRSKLPDLTSALTGRFGPHHSFLLARMLAHVGDLEADIQAVLDRIEEALVPFERELELLDSVTGVGRLAAGSILAEIGADMTVFPTARHLASWARICPAQHESAGKRKAVRIGQGSRWLRTTLIECAHAASKTNGTYIGERYRVLARRRGKKKAIVATAHEILTACYWVLSKGEPYAERGPQLVRDEAQEAAKRRAVSALHKLGYAVSLNELPKPA